MFGREINFIKYDFKKNEHQHGLKNSAKKFLTGINRLVIFTCLKILKNQCFFIIFPISCHQQVRDIFGLFLIRHGQKQEVSFDNEHATTRQNFKNSIIHQVLKYIEVNLCLLLVRYQRS